MARLLLALLLAGDAVAQYGRGVNLAGAEFGDQHLPGILGHDFTYNSEASFRYFAGQGLWLIRLPIRWERIQPSLSGPLDPVNLRLLQQDIDWARKYGARIILDIHNYGRYRIQETQLNEYIIDNAYNGVVKVSRNDLADLWVRLSAEFRDDVAVYGYDLMNEPHDMGAGDWKAISQAVLAAIRAADDNKLILVPGDNWSAAQSWPHTHGPAGWIVDPANNFRYEAHQYFDHDNSGSYRLSYEQEGATPDIGAIRVAPFLDWCRANGVAGYLGEYGVPDNDPRWMVVLDNFLAALDAAAFPGTYWAAGEWWGSYPLSVQPASGPASDRPQAAILAAHLGDPTPFSAIAATGIVLPALAPDSMAIGYGSGLAAADSIELVDHTGATLAAPVQVVSSSQVNFVVPPATAPGAVKVTVRAAGAAVDRGSFQVDRVAPSVFSVGKGVAAATVLRIQADGSANSTAASDGPIDFGDPSDRLFLELYATGLRNASAVSLTVGDYPLPVLYAGPHQQVIGLDQVNVELPRALAGAGTVQVVLTADGKAANPALLSFR